MSNTSTNKTANKPTKSNKDKDKLRVIVGEIGRDTKTGILGRGYSNDNGKTFHVTDTMYGRLYDPNDIDGIWNGGTADRVKKEVDSATAEIPAAVSAANSAVSAAESAVAASKVNSDAIVAQSEAISEAKSAMDSATAEIQQTAANAASDAAKIRADVARVQNEVDTAKAANSASVDALKSDIDTAKQDLANVHDSLTKAQSAVEQNQKLINDNVAKITSDVSATKQDLATVHDSLTKAQAAAEQNQKAINDSIAEINANVDATNQDLAGVRKDLTKAQSDITANQKAIDDNVAQISDDITQDRKDIADVRQGLTKAQSDIIANQKAVNDNVAQINSDIEQDRKDIASAQQANADTVKQLDAYSKQAQEQGKTIKAVQDKQDGFSATLADVQGNVSQVSDKVSGLSASLKDAQDNVASVKAQADQLSATLTNHGKSIATLTASAKELSSTLEDADGRLSKVEQTAQTNSSTLSDVQGDLSQVKQNATKLVSTLKDAQGNISTLQQKADSLSTQLASAQGDIATLQTGVDSVKATLTSHDKSIHTLQADSKSLKDSMVNAQGDISTLRKTATDVTSELEDHTGRLSKVEQSAAKQATTLSDLQGNLSQVEQKADSNTATISSINKNAMQDRGVITDTKTSFDSLTQLGTYSIKASGLPKMPEQHYGTLVVSGSAGSGWLSQQFVADTTGNVYTRVFSNNAWSAWKQGGSQDDINQVKQTADSNSATIRNVQGDVNTLKQTATGIKSTLASHEGDIHTLQLDSKSLKDSMADAQGDISALSKTATSLDSEMKDHAGRLSKVEQSAATQATTLSDLQGNLTQVKQQADGLVTTLKDAQGSITQIQQKADGMLEQLKSAQGDIASLQTDVTGIKATLTSHEGDIHTLQADSRMLKDDMKDAQGNISSLQKSSTKLDSEMSSQGGRLSKVEQTAKEHTSTISDLGDKLSNLKVSTSNLLHNSDTFAGWVKNATASISKDKYLNGSILVMSPSKIGADGVNTDLDGPYDDQLVTWTVYAKADNAGDKLHTELWGGGGVTDQPLTTDWKLYKFSGHRDSRDHHFYLWGWQGNKGNIYVALPYAVVGNTIGSWLPNPADLATLTQVKQTADGIETTLKSAQGDIDQIKQTAKGTSEQLSNVQGNVTNIQKDVDGLKQTTADNAGNIHTLQADSKALQDDMKDAKGNISSLQKTATSLDSEFKDHDGRLSKVEQTASTLTNEFSDQQGHLNRVEQTAQGTQKTVANQQGQINNIKTDAAGMHQTITGQGNQIANINVTLNGLNTKYEGVSGDLNKLKSQAQWVTVTSAVDLNNVKTPCHEFLKGTVTNAPNETAWWYLTVESSDDGNRVTQTVIADQSNNRYTRRWADVWSAWVKDATQTDFTALSNRITTNFTQITQNKQAIALKADQSTVGNLSGEVSQNTAQLKVQADQISSKVSSEDFKTLDNKVGGAIAQIDKNTTAIDQTNKQISLKADQKEVDKIKNTATQNSSRLNVMANEISSKVTSTDVNNIVDSKGYATTSTVQSLITQKAGTINESITNLTNEVNTRNGVNLLKGTKDFSGSWHNDGSTNCWHTENWIDPNGNHSVKSDSLSWYGYYQPIYLDTGDYTFSGYYYSEGGKPVFCYLRPNSGDNLVEVSYNSNLDSTPNGWRWFVVHFKVTKAGNAAVRLESGQNQILHIASYKLERGTVANPVWTPAPSDNATVTQVQQITTSIDGLQSTVANKADKSQITQLSNLVQSKVSTSDFNDLKDKTLWKSTDSIDLNTVVSQQKIFVKGGSNLPPGSYWWYVQVEPGYDSRIVQYAVSDRDNLHYSRQYDGSKWSAWSQGATESEITQLRDDINLRVKSGDLLSQINIQAGRTLIQSQKIYMDADSVIMGPNTRAFIPSAAIVSLDADKINTGTLNTQMVSIGDDQTRLWARSNYLYLTGKDQGDAYNMRIGGDKIEFVTTEIPNDAPYLDGITPMYTIEYNGDAKARLKVRSFNRLTGSNEFPVEMYDSVNISKDELDFAANNQMKMQVVDGGVNVRPSLFFQNNSSNGTWAGFTRADNSNVVQFSTGDNNGENFRVDSGARFTQYLYINGNARAQQWLTNSALSKKMNIRKLDLQTALNKIRQDDQYLYEYKRNVAQGIHDPQASFIIDDVHDVAHYSVPREFIDQTGKYREPNVELAYLIAAFQAIDKQVQAQQAEIKILKEQLQHE